MSPDLRLYLPAADVRLKDLAHPHWLTEKLADLCVALSELDEPNMWKDVTDKFREDVEHHVKTGRIHGQLSAAVLFVVDCLEASVSSSDHGFAKKVISFVRVLSVSEEEWVNILKFADSSQRFGDIQKRKIMRIGEFPDEVLRISLANAKEKFLRELYRLVRLRVDAFYRRAISSTENLESWKENLAILAAYLRVRFWLPLKSFPDDGEEVTYTIEFYEGGARVIPSSEQSELPLIKKLFNEQERNVLHRKAAASDEYEAHLFTSIACGFVEERHQAKMLQEFEERAAIDSISARQWLALGKSRFEIAPYVRAT